MAAISPGLHTRIKALHQEGKSVPAIAARLNEEGFVPPVCREMLLVETEPATLLDRFADYRAPAVRKWITRDEET